MYDFNNILKIILFLLVLLFFYNINVNKNSLNNVNSPQELWFDVKKSLIPNAGRGVFTKKKFKKDDIVMSSPMLLIPNKEINKNFLLYKYAGQLNKNYFFLTFDYQGLVNTTKSDECNIRAVWRTNEHISQYVALRDIDIGEELYQDYTNALILN